MEMKVSLEAGDVGTSLAVHWLRLRASTAGAIGSIPAQGIKILHAAWCSQKKKKKRVMDGEERKDKINTSKS